MDPACWQPEKGCPAVGLTWVSNRGLAEAPAALKRIGQQQNKAIPTCIKFRVALPAGV
ncbi:uncharacterized protein TrAtP1_004865 [Trichoderma atroviride]|uniref:uncharacterized protein n=1 Tax=Hypocrea atroviridis TaxID=63577 RepID=UPI00331665F4|nr:hypothetical protein TrAtP1_004865 [Trichoderma atroviride]